MGGGGRGRASDTAIEADSNAQHSQGTAPLQGLRVPNPICTSDLGAPPSRVRVLQEHYTVLTWLFGRKANKSQLKKATEYSFFLGRLSFRVEIRKLYKPTTW